MIILVNVFAILLLVAFILGILAPRVLYICVLYTLVFPAVQQNGYFKTWIRIPFTSIQNSFSNMNTMSFDEQNFSLERQRKEILALKKYPESHGSLFTCILDSRTFTGPERRSKTVMKCMNWEPWLNQVSSYGYSSFSITSEPWIVISINSGLVILYPIFQKHSYYLPQHAWKWFKTSVPFYKIFCKIHY